MQTLELVIGGNEGLHARPAAELVRIASAPETTVKVGRAGQPAVAAGSILALLSLGLRSGERVVFTIAGPDEDSVAQQINELLGK